MSADQFVTCPFDESHRPLRSRLQIHMATCKLDHPEKAVCDFNATHVFDPAEKDYHLLHCPDRQVFDKLMTQNLDKNNPYKGCTAVPQSSDPHIDDEEDWDADSPRVTVRPSKPPPGVIIEPEPMSKPAERKKLYRNLHQVSSEPEKKPSSDIQVLRQPMQKSQGEQVQMTNPKVIENLGMGRGKPSRIAANFFANSSNGPAKNATYSNIVKDCNNLDLAQGQPVNEATAAPIFEKDDFPALE